MNEREMLPWGELIKQWEGETPLLLTDQAVGQLLQFAKETTQQLAQQKEINQELSMKLADVRAQVKVFLEEGGIADV